MSIEQNKLTVKRFWEAFSTNDQKTALSLLGDEGFSWWILGDSSLFCLAGTLDKAQFAGLLKGVMDNTKQGLTMTIKGLTAEGDRVAVEAESYGEMSNGKIYNNLYHFLMIVRDGKICQVKEFLDTQHAAEVLCD